MPRAGVQISCNKLMATCRRASGVALFATGYGAASSSSCSMCLLAQMSVSGALSVNVSLKTLLCCTGIALSVGWARKL